MGRLRMKAPAIAFHKNPLQFSGHFRKNFSYPFPAVSMSISDQLEQFLHLLAESRRDEIRKIHQLILEVEPGSRLWFSDGKNSEGRTIANPTLGYGSFCLSYADGSSKEVFQVGLSATASGISLYLMAVRSKGLLAETFGGKIGKAGISNYCIKFRRLKDIDHEVLKEAIRFGFEARP